jgi:hypothetical protein
VVPTRREIKLYFRYSKMLSSIERTTISVYPLQGIDISGIGQINLGQSKSAVENVLGKPDSHSDSNRWFYDVYECRIDFDESDIVDFIEFIYGPFPKRIRLSLYGIDPFRIGAKNLVEMLSEKNNGEIDDREAEYCYGFVNISVGIWRDMTEKDAEEMIAEKKENGDYEFDRTWLKEELEKSRNFSTIGIGKVGYY